MKTFPQVEGILASGHRNVIGDPSDPSGLPWKHVEDMKKFVKITKGHALLIGFKTLLGIAKMVPDTPTLLSNRTLIVIGTPKFTHSCSDSDFDGEFAYKSYRDKCVLEEFYEALPLAKQKIDNVKAICTTDNPEDDIRRALKMIDPSQKLLIAGGAQIYDKYLEFASTIYWTLIDGKIPNRPDLITLTPKTVQFLSKRSGIFTSEFYSGNYEGETVANWLILNRITNEAFQYEY